MRAWRPIKLWWPESLPGCWCAAGSASRAKEGIAWKALRRLIRDLKRRHRLLAESLYQRSTHRPSAAPIRVVRAIPAVYQIATNGAALSVQWKA